MKKFLSIVACFMVALTSLAFVSCNSTPKHTKLKLNLPAKLYVEYNTGAYQNVAYAKDGNDYYVHYQNLTYGYEYKDIYVHTTSSDYQTAYWHENNWVAATDQSTNDIYEQQYYNTVEARYLANGLYNSRVDLHGEKQENQSVSVNGQDIECVVYYVAQDNQTYWYEKDTFVLIQFQEDGEIKMKAVKFDTTLSMANMLSTYRGINILPVFA